MKRVAIMTTVRNDTLFLTRWIAYYGGIFGMQNLFVIFDGHDQTIPIEARAVNTIQRDHRREVPRQSLLKFRRRPVCQL